MQKEVTNCDGIFSVGDEIMLYDRHDAMHGTDVQFGKITEIHPFCYTVVNANGNEQNIFKNVLHSITQKVIPIQDLNQEVLDELRSNTKKIAELLKLNEALWDKNSTSDVCWDLKSNK